MSKRARITIRIVEIVKIIDRQIPRRVLRFMRVRFERFSQIMSLGGGAFEMNQLLIFISFDASEFLAISLIRSRSVKVS